MRRVPNPDDARSTLAEITDKGRALVATATDELNTKVFEAVTLTESELDTLFGLLEKIRVDVGDFARRERSLVD